MTAPSDTDAEAWANVLEKLEEDTRIPAGSSAIFIDTFFRVIGEREMLFIKRNEARFWTRTAAREDAEAAMVVLMHRKRPGGGEQMNSRVPVFFPVTCGRSTQRDFLPFSNGLSSCSKRRPNFHVLKSS